MVGEASVDALQAVCPKAPPSLFFFRQGSGGGALPPLPRACAPMCALSLSLSLSLADGEKPHKVSERDAECADKGFNGGKSARS